MPPALHMYMLRTTKDGTTVLRWQHAVLILREVAQGSQYELASWVAEPRSIPNQADNLRLCEAHVRIATHGRQHLVTQRIGLIFPEIADRPQRRGNRFLLSR